MDQAMDYMKEIDAYLQAKQDITLVKDCE